MYEFDSDRLGSDDLDAVYQISKVQESREQSTSSTRALMHGHTGDLPASLAGIDNEISRVEDEIKRLHSLLDSLCEERTAMVTEIQASHLPKAPINSKNKGKEKTTSIDYTTEDFLWSHELKSRMKKVWNINEFRLCQQGVCNANLDGRDIVCIMPTGGGKSLTYQLPALFSHGCTLVISPLIALMTDQILHLREANVEAVMLSGSTSPAENKLIFDRLRYPPANPEQGIKLCYVTPEKIAKNKRFKALLTEMDTNNRLVRIVIDEAHCISQMGHDFRPDYKQLSVLRSLFPRVPILALSATCPPRVLEDIRKILNLKGMTMGTEAEPGMTVYFSSPLYRKNLHYSVVPKPTSDKLAIQAMSEYILKNHENESGIVYCSTKAHTETIAKGLEEVSLGKIKIGVYHADVPDQIKGRLHQHWREGKINVVCATIAFGLGIDKGNVRFVMHHSISKSLEGYYQESGRAGRDGKDADCVLFYRPQDLSTVGGQCLTAPEKVHDILRYAQNLKECRKIIFAKYFSASANLSLSSWTTEDEDALAKCGHCDNCTRPPESFINGMDVTLESWQMLKVAQEAKRLKRKVTVAMLATLSRSERSVEKLDLGKIAGGKVMLTQNDATTLIVHLLYEGYLFQIFRQMQHKTVVYLEPTDQAQKLTVFSWDAIIAGKGPKVTCSFVPKDRKSRTMESKEASTSSAKIRSTVAKEVAISSGKRKREVREDTDEEVSDLETECYDDDDDDDMHEYDDGIGAAQGSRSSRFSKVTKGFPEDEGESEYEWSNSLREPLRSGKRSRKITLSPPHEVIEVSD